MSFLYINKLASLMIIWNLLDITLKNPYLIVLVGDFNAYTHRRVARNFLGQGRFQQIRAHIFGSSASQS